MLCELRVFCKIFYHSSWMWGIFHIILSVPHTTVMDLNNVMTEHIVKKWNTSNNQLSLHYRNCLDNGLTDGMNNDAHNRFHYTLLNHPPFHLRKLWPKNSFQVSKNTNVDPLGRQLWLSPSLGCPQTVLDHTEFTCFDFTKFGVSAHRSIFALEFMPLHCKISTAVPYLQKHALRNLHDDKNKQKKTS